MFRTVTSDVSAVSNFVPNSRQSMQHVSSSLSKIPYVGFSPVELKSVEQAKRDTSPRAFTRVAVDHSTATGIVRISWTPNRRGAT